MAGRACSILVLVSLLGVATASGFARRSLFNCDTPTNSTVNGPQCDCDHHTGDVSAGCSISEVPPPNTACKCISSGVRCDGQVTTCADPNSQWCKNPTDNIFTCLQGQGDCDGYGEGNECDCDHKNGFGGGCIISTAPPRGTACRCVSHGVSCSGEITLCAQDNAPACKNPTVNLATCLQGGGDCDAYDEATCDCAASVNVLGIGCKITRPSPAGTACRCSLVQISADPGVCKGSVVLCADPNSPQCIKPDTSAEACAQGMGTCLYAPFGALTPPSPKPKH